VSNTYLDHLRARNIAIASICHYCKKQSTGINSDGYRILFVCEDHYIPDNPNVVHQIFSGGLNVEYVNTLLESQSSFEE